MHEEGGKLLKYSYGMTSIMEDLSLSSSLALTIWLWSTEQFHDLGWWIHNWTTEPFCCLTLDGNFLFHSEMALILHSLLVTNDSFFLHNVCGNTESQRLIYKKNHQYFQELYYIALKNPSPKSAIFIKLYQSQWVNELKSLLYLYN